MSKTRTLCVWPSSGADLAIGNSSAGQRVITAAGPATLFVAGLLVACASSQAPAPVVVTQPPVVISPPVVIPPPVPEPAPAVIETPPTPTPSPVAPQDVPRTIAVAIEFLQAGQEEQAEQELKRVLLGDPNNRHALSLLKQLKDDPIATLGRESFAYRVQPGESLSRIAQRFLGDVQQFYILARYNNLKVPRTLAEGQTIRVPGKAPPVVAGTGAATPAPTVVTPSSDPAPDSAAAADRQKAETIARHMREARGAFAKQDLDSALRSWEAVLKLDPDNRTAFLEREKIRGLKEKLGKLK